MIHTITVLRSKDPHRQNRCMGFYFQEERAREAILHNYGDTHEDYYDYLVLEKFEEGILRIGQQIQWYTWNNGWTECQKPTFVENTVNWGLC